LGSAKEFGRQDLGGVKAQIGQQCSDPSGQRQIKMATATDSSLSVWSLKALAFIGWESFFSFFGQLPESFWG